MRPRILIVEDEPGIADTLQYALRTDGFEPAWVSTGAEALAHVRAQLPALVILDVGLPDANGFEVFKRLREFSDVPVVFLTARSDEIDRVVGLELGADDYVAKPPAPVSATATTATAAAPAPLRVDEGRRQIRFYGSLLELSRYEFGLLQTLASRPGHVYSRDALLLQVWGDATESMDRTVDAHVKTVRAKMKLVAPLLEPIRTHRGSGYCLAEDLPATLPGH